MVTFQQGHFGFCVFVSKGKFFRNHKVNFDSSWQWIILVFTGYFWGNFGYSSMLISSKMTVP
ncbi:hypothetical protein I79_011223 [Cricetulus griseus]|uniref:Uncharacterized protein n=1 Tax=Cricetulus griseus TaxID=10029 RepID=G3HKJ5_CRIGR|nr:hypothetical protein I79_011223 [Cricetulus griseus]